MAAIQNALQDRMVDRVTWTLESTIDEAFLGSVSEVHEPEVREVFEMDAGTVAVELRLQVDGDVELVSFNPSPWDTDRLGGSSLLSNVTSGAPIIQTSEPKDLEATVQVEWLVARSAWGPKIEIARLEEIDR